MSVAETESRLERRLEILALQLGRLAESVARLEAQAQSAARSRELARAELRELKAALGAVGQGIEEYRRDRRGAWGLLAGLGLASGGIGAALTRWLGS